MTDKSFRDFYCELEARMRVVAKAGGEVFLPNPEPVGPVDYVFICMEPSLGRWAHLPEDATSKVNAGFRNFISSIEDFLLHFCIRQYLCDSTQRYHLTDLAKGAMLVKHADLARAQRYDRWYALLLEELALVAAPGAGIVAVGNDVARHLERRRFPRPFIQVIHYSGLAGRARAAGIVGHEESFETFKRSVSMQHVIATAQQVLTAFAVPARFRDGALARLRTGQLSESRQQLIFNYKLAFETMRIARPEV